MAQKRVLDSFFTPVSQKKARVEEVQGNVGEIPPSHHTYPFPVPNFPQIILEDLATVPASSARPVSDEPDLDLLYFQPFIPPSIERDLFVFLRRSLFFYRVQYNIKRGGSETQINTPRYTTVFGVDTLSVFSRAADGRPFLGESTAPSKPVPKDRYRTCVPRPLPDCLDHLRCLTEVFTEADYNFCLVNYYSSGTDSISYHSDDEHFLGPNPSIASFSLGATRDFCMKHKPVTPSAADPNPEQHQKPPLKLPLASGDMVLMRGRTQANWLHSIPKRKGKGSQGGRINITFRKGIKPYATENYYQYNVGDGPAYKWDDRAKEMKLWEGEGKTCL